MKVKLIKILMLMLTIILLLGTSQVLAINTNDYKPGAIGQGGSSKFIGKAGDLLVVISTVGTVCSVIIIAVIGIKYMLGSVEEKAEYKKTMTTYVAGAVLLFSCTTIPNMIYHITNPKYVYLEKRDGVYCATCQETNKRKKTKYSTVCVVEKHKKSYNVHYVCNFCGETLTELERIYQVCEKCNPGLAEWLQTDTDCVYVDGEWKACGKCGNLFVSQSDRACRWCRDKTQEIKLTQRKFCVTCGYDYNYKTENEDKLVCETCKITRTHN